jgi:hypothetical protein
MLFPAGGEAQARFGRVFERRELAARRKPRAYRRQRNDLRSRSWAFDEFGVE